MFLRYNVVVIVGLIAASTVYAGQQEKIEGTWKVVSLVEDGKEEKDEKEITMTFKGDKFTIHQKGEAIIEGTFKTDPAKKPAHIDLSITKGPNERFQGKTAKGIYRFMDGKLQWCASEPGNETRPMEFAAPPGSRVLFVTMERQKAEK